MSVGAALLLTGCGDDDGPPDPIPAAGENTPPSGTPGVPEGAAYDVDGTEWLELRQKEQFAAAGEYIAENPSRCEDAKASDVSFYVTNSYGLDFPLDIPAVDVLAEGCDAARQS